MRKILTFAFPMQMGKVARMRRMGAFSFIIFLIGSLSFANINFDSIQKHAACFSFGIDSYNISETEQITLYGAKRIHYISDNWYWGEAGYGAIFGRRSGYIEGGVVFGAIHKMFGEQIFWDGQVFFGAGGGGGAPQGGGMIIQPNLGVGIKLNNQFNLFAKIGYMYFINGNISSPSLEVGLHYNYWEVAYEK